MRPSSDWLTASKQVLNKRTRQSLTVCDTAFEGGLRFVALWDYWRSVALPETQLHVVAFVGCPLSLTALRNTLNARLPHFERLYADQLLEQWPMALPGVHRLSFDEGYVTLTLFFQPVAVALKQCQAIVDLFWVPNTAELLGGACGLSPMGQLVRMASANAKLVAEPLQNPSLDKSLGRAGFQVESCTQSGQSLVEAKLRPGLCHTQKSGDARASVAVVGAGVAGAAIARGLAQRGHQVQVFDPLLELGPAGVHQEHQAAAMTPLISRDDDYRARLTRAGVTRAWANWSGLSAKARPERFGTLKLPLDRQQAAGWKRTLQVLNFPSNWVKWVGPAEAAALVGDSVACGGCYFSQGYRVRPDILIPELLSDPKIQLHNEQVATIAPCVTRGWLITTVSGRVFYSKVLVLANARHIWSLLGKVFHSPGLPKLGQMEAFPGQVSYFDAMNVGGGPKCMLEAAAYWLPQVNGMVTAGGTYMHDNSPAQVTQPGHDEILQKLIGALPLRAQMLSQRGAVRGGWAGWRVVVPGRLPVIGPINALPGLWVASAFGSRGLTWASLAADVIGAHLNNEPAILERDLLAAIRPR